MPYSAKQGDIVWINLDPFPPGQQDEQKEKCRRPALVVSNDTFNAFVKTAAMLCPIISVDRGIPIRIKLDNRTRTDGVILCDQAKLVDVQEGRAEWIERAPEDVVLEVIDAIYSFIEVGG